MTAASGADAAATPAVMPRRRAADASPTRSRLLAAARQVIESGGYASASVLAIAEAAGVASGTLYRHFPSKADLFVEVFREVCGHEMVAAEQAAQRHAADGPVAQLDATITVFAERALSNPTLAWSLIAEPVDPAVERVRLEFRAAYRTTVAQLVRDGMGRGDLPPQNAELTATALVGAANEVLAGPLAHTGSTAEATDVVGELRALWLRTAGA